MFIILEKNCENKFPRYNEKISKNEVLLICAWKGY